MHSDYYTLQDMVTLPACGEATDEELMARIQRRDEQALGEMHRRHAGLLRTVISHVVNHDQDTNDLVQEVFLELWNQAEHYDHAKGKALGWMVTLARRRAIDKLRRRQAYSRATERMRAELAPLPVVSDCVEDDVIASETKEMLRRIVARLPDSQREAIEFAYYQGLSQREIAAKTGIPLGTIKTRIELAVSKVRSAVLALGGKSAWRSGSHDHTRPHAVMPKRLSLA